MGEHSKGDLEEEAYCRIREAGGVAAGNGTGYHFLRRWYGYFDQKLADMVRPAKDGKARNGSLNRLGEVKGKGRGQEKDDACIKVTACRGQIVEMVPVQLKGCKADGYGNRDLTMRHEAAFAFAQAGIPQWAMLLKGDPTNLLMRLVDVTRVIQAQLAGELPEGTVKVRDDVRRDVTAKPSRKATSSVWNPEALVKDKDGNITQVGGYENVRDYTRLRIEWARVKNVRPDLFLDADFIPFKAELPIGL